MEIKKERENMKKRVVKGKRLLSVFLAVIMIMSGMLSIPVTGYAAEPEVMEANDGEMKETGDGQQEPEDLSEGTTETSPSTELEDAPVQTPEGTEEVSPSAEPTQTPEEIPEVSPSAEPEETPEQTPENNEDIMVSPTPTVSPLPSVDPLVGESELAYTGNEYDLGRGYMLEIHQSLMENAGMDWNEENILKILDTRAKGERRYHYVSLVEQSGNLMENVSVSIWNRMLNVMEPSTNDNFTYIEIQKQGNASQPMQQWYFFAPVQASESINTEFSYELQEDGMGMKTHGIKRKFPVSADVSMNLYVAESETLYSEFSNAFDVNESYSVYDMNGKNSSNQVEVKNLTNSGGSTVTLQISLQYGSIFTSGNDYYISGYRGNVSEGYGRKFLSIYKPGSFFTEKQLIRILEANEGNKFDSITINQYGTESNIVYKSITNKAKNLLNENGALSWHYTRSGTNFTESWYMNGLTTQENDLTVTAEMAIGDQVTFIVSDTELPATRASVSVTVMPGAEYNRLRDIFGEENKTLVARKEGDNSAIRSHYTFSQYSASVQIENLSDLEAGSKYIIGEQLEYYGTITDKNGWKELLVDNSEEKYSEEQLIEILNMNKQGDFDSIQIRLGTNNVISQSVHNAAYALLKNSYRGMIEYRCQKEDGSLASVILSQPETTENDMTIDISCYVEDGEVHFKNTSQAYPAGYVAAGFVFYEGDTYNGLKEVMGISKNLAFTAWNGEDTASGNYQYIAATKSYPAQIAVSVSDIGKLKAGAVYTIDGYRGSVDENGLYLSAVSMDKKQFDIKDIEHIVNYYEKTDTRFSTITVDQDYSNGKNSEYTISKDMINALRNILAENGDIVFCFSRGIVKEDGQGGLYLQNDLNLNLVAPGEAKKDIVINASITAVANQGVNLKLNKQIEAVAEHTGLQIFVDPQADLGIQLQQALGEIEPGKQGQTIILENNDLKEEQNADYSRMSETEETNLSLYFSDIDQWKKGTAYKIVSYENSEQEFVCGSTVELQKPGNLGKGKKITWKAYGSGVVSDVTADDSLFVGEIPDAEFYYSATYSDGKQTYMKVWKGCTKQAPLTRIAFDRTNIMVDLPVQESDQVTGYLNVKSYPANVDLVWEKLQWTCNNPDVIELVRNEKGTCTGEWIAKKDGTAEVTVKYSDDIKATCRFIVRKALTDADTGAEKIYRNGLYAVLNFDQTLEAVELPDNWKWSAPDTKLSAYGNAEGYNFPAIYTSPEDGRTITRSFYVRFVNIGLDFASQDEMIMDEATDLQVVYDIENGNRQELNRYLDGKTVEWKWECKDKNVRFDEPSESEALEKGSKSVRFSTTGKKTVTLLMIVDGKPVLKTSHQIKVIKVNKRIDWENVKTVFKEDYSGNLGEIGTKGELIFTQSQDNKFNLTVTSSDSKVLKLGKAKTGKVDTEGNITITVPYEILSSGITYVTVTAADDMKSSYSVRLEWTDKTPRLAYDTISINKAADNASAEIVLYAANGYPVDLGQIAIVGTDNFKVTDCSESENKRTVKVTVALKNAEVKKGTYKAVEIKVPVIDEDEKAETAFLELAIKVTDDKPSVNFKQTKKVNLFYTDEEGWGELTVTSQDAIKNLKLSGCDYELTEENGNYRIRLKDGFSGKNVKGILTYDVKGYRNSYTANFSVGKENKAPVIVASAKGNTLYTATGQTMVKLTLTDKESGKEFNFSSITTTQKKQIYQITDEVQEIAVGQNVYRVKLAEKEGSSVQFSYVSGKEGSDSVALNVQEKNWSKPLKVTYKLTVTAKEPSLQLGQKKLILNRNDDVFAGEVAIAPLAWKDNNTLIDSGVSFEAKNKASQEVLNQSLILQYWADQGIVVARLNDNNLATGSYKYKVCVNKKSADLEINVVDKEAEKCITLKKAGGNIDVLRRENTSLNYNIKLNNISGTVDGVYLQGRDGDLFDARINAKGQLEIYAREGAFSTKVNYSLQPVLIIWNEYSGTREVVAPDLSIKVKQGTPKLIASTNGNVFYRQKDNTVSVNMTAILNDQKIIMDSADITKYGEYFQVDDSKLMSDGYVILSMMPNGRSSAYSQSGKEWKIELTVRFRDKAGNEKNQKVICPVIVR